MKTKKIVAFILLFAVILNLFILPTSASTSYADIIKSNNEKLNAVVAEVMSLLNPEMSDFEKVTILYDWMLVNVKYAASKSKSSAYNALVEGRAVCAGQASGYKLLLDTAGIENVRVSGKLLGGGHAWNMVKLNGEWYHTDVTNDAIGDYSNFLVSDNNEDFKRRYQWRDRPQILPLVGQRKEIHLKLWQNPFTIMIMNRKAF